MTPATPSAADVVKSTDADRDFVLDWLQREHQQHGSGFWSNRNIIARAHDDGELWVIRENDQAVAFQVGDHAADIVSVRHDCRGGGYGTALFQASLERAVRDDVNVLEGQCAPETSLGFWNRMGFEQYDNWRRPDELRVRRVLPKAFPLPPDLPRATVTVSFLPERALYSAGETVTPIATYVIEGAVRPDGSVMLSRRALGLADDEPDSHDLAVRIEIDGNERILAKGKYAGAAGVKHDWRGDAFFVDIVMPLTSDEAQR
ncbi:GNAT family N-acetyltransferase [Sphingomonas sp. Leaf198]|uniref:GNAT family N-acetyltransferase n=1 Tax=Sphingomonas sp. Leaf198 TaxID=1736299 RepID=UPI0006F9A647|nr:GNAT family N-acetyltransferase [Sphingomonas sp. Leaf198]KQS49498.1 hypothetical protein ASG20_10900 [Sphingomonas sp. Leaf198]